MQLADFYDTIADDPRINAFHVSLYFALVHQWEQSGKPASFELDKGVLMKNSKVSSRTTYDKLLHDLHSFGYIIYHPVSGRGKSLVEIKRI